MGHFLASFKDEIEGTSLRKHSRIVLALDTISGKTRFSVDDAARLLDKVGDWVVGVKLGLPFYLNVGNKTRDLVDSFRDVVFIADWKTADVPHVTKLIFEGLFDLGFRAAIIHAFVGTEPLSEAINVARSHGGEAIAVVAMSHRGSDLINTRMLELAAMASSVGVDCFVAPSNSPELLRALRAKYGSAKIFCPGVGAQGGEVKLPLKLGADYLIVGRLITDSADPGYTAERVAEHSWTL